MKANVWGESWVSRIIAAAGVGSIAGLLGSAGVPAASALEVVDRGGAPVTVEVEADRPLVVSGRDDEIVFRIRVGGCVVPADDVRQPVNLAVVFDRSGSMEGAKIEQARQAATMLVDRMDADDVFSLVAYDHEAEVLLPPRKVGDREALKRAIRRLAPGGSTALYDGVKTGAAQLREYLSDRRINRVILLSDGLANVGPSTPREIADLGRRLADEGIPVSTIGLGDDYSEVVLSALAEASDANYYYVRDVEALPDVFRREFGELQRLVARDLVIEIVFADGIKPVGIVGRDEPIEKNRLRLELQSLAGGQQRDYFVRCRVAAGERSAAGSDLAVPVAEVRARFADLLADGRSAETPATALAVRATDDPSAAESAVRRDLEVAWQLVDINAETDRALKLAESGATDAAQAALGTQRDRLMQLQQAAPSEAQRGVVAEDLELLDRFDTDLASGGAVEKDTAKSLHFRFYQRRNAKQQDPTPAPGE